MEKSELDVRFHHRPSRPSLYPSSSKLKLFQKRISSTTDIDVSEKVSEDSNDITKNLHNKQLLVRKSISLVENKINGFDAQFGRDHLSEALKKEGIDLDLSSLENMLHRELTNNYLKCICFTSAYVINNHFGAYGPESVDLQSLLQYRNQLLHLPSNIKQEYLEKVKNIKAPAYILAVEVLEAKNLISTDADCLSDPYCKIWINDQKESMKRTSVKKRTLNPEWNERFSFPLKDIINDIIHIEIWDKDIQGFRTNIKQIKNIKGFKGCRQFCRECCRNVCICCSFETDDFVAKVDILVSEIYSEGFNNWLELKDVKNRKTEAQLHISMKFETLRPKHILDALKRHLLLLKVCLQQAINEKGESYLTLDFWEQLLSPSAVALIFQHKVQSGLTSFEDALCRFIVFVHFMENQFSLNYPFLFVITNETHEKAQEFVQTDYGLEKCVDDLYRDAVKNVYEICKSVITKLHSFDFVEDKNKCVEFEFVLKCAVLCHDTVGNGDFMWPDFKSEARSWFDKLSKEINNIASDRKTNFLSTNLSFILSYHLSLDKVVKNVFPDKSYTLLILEVLDFVLSDLLKSHIAELSKDYLHKKSKFTETLDLFLKIKELNDYVTEITKIPESDLQLANFREWFGFSAIKEWFRFKEEIMIEKIRQTVTMDNLDSQVTEIDGRLEKQSPSVKLIINLIQKELIQLRNKTFHPKFSSIDFTFIDVLHSVCMKYAEFLLDLVYSRNILDTFQSTGKKKVFTMVNNLWSLSVFVQQTILDTIKNIPPDNYDTKFNLRFMCLILCSDICKEFESDIVSLIENIVVANSPRKQSQYVKIYVSRIHQLFIKEAMPHMAFEVYLIFMKEVVKTVTKVVAFFKEAYKNEESVTFLNKIKNLFFPKPSVASGLLGVVTETEGLIFKVVQGNVKINQEFWTDDYQRLKDELQQSLVTG